MHRPITFTPRPDLRGPKASDAWVIAVRKELQVYAARMADTGDIVVRVHWDDGVEHMSATTVKFYSELVAYATRLRTNHRKFKRRMRRWNGR